MRYLRVPVQQTILRRQINRTRARDLEQCAIRSSLWVLKKVLKESLDFLPPSHRTGALCKKKARNQSILGHSCGRYWIRTSDLLLVRQAL